MGDVSRAVFGRDQLPDRAIIRAGAYFDDRTQRTLDQFDEVGEMKGKWMPYCYATKSGQEFLVVFNVYGAAPTLEVIRVMQEGGVKMVGFIGSAFSKRGEIGSQLLVTKVYDQAGICQLIGVKEIDRAEHLVEQQRKYYSEVTEVTIASVPCVMHQIEEVSEFVAGDDVDGVEMELSTFFYFADQSGMDSYACVYVSDNPTYSLLEDEVAQLRHEGMITSTRVLLSTMTDQ